MSDDKQSMFEKLMLELNQQRDELRLQMHLGGMEAKEQLSKLDDKVYELRKKYAPSKEAINEASEEVWDTIKTIGSEIRDGFDRVRKSLEKK